MRTYKACVSMPVPPSVRVGNRILRGALRHPWKIPSIPSYSELGNVPGFYLCFCYFLSLTFKNIFTKTLCHRVRIRILNVWHLLKELCSHKLISIFWCSILLRLHLLIWKCLTCNGSENRTLGKVFWKSLLTIKHQN